MLKERELPSLPENERNTCLELGNWLLGLNYVVIDTYRAKKSEEEREEFVRKFEDALRTLYLSTGIYCHCGKCGNGLCCACPSTN